MRTDTATPSQVLAPLLVDVSISSVLHRSAGGPNSNDSNSNKLLHHTIGLLDREQEMRCFEQVTCAQVGGSPSVLSTFKGLINTSQSNCG